MRDLSTIVPEAQEHILHAPPINFHYPSHITVYLALQRWNG